MQKHKFPSFSKILWELLLIMALPAVFLFFAFGWLLYAVSDES
jgi:hypothetical protein